MLFKKAARKTKIRKRCNPHIFRHSRATLLAQHLTEAQLKQVFGWTQSSKMASVYVHLSGRDNDDAYDTPVLIIGENAVKYIKKLPAFEKVTRFSLIESGNEINFIINRKLDKLKQTKHYKNLINLGFRDDICLANKSFVNRCIDE